VTEQQKPKGGRPRKYKRADKRFSRKLTIGYTATGKQIQRSVYGSTASEANEKLHELKRQLSEGRLTEPSKITLEAYLRGWLADRKGSVRESTHHFYTYDVEHYLIPRVGKYYLNRFTPAQAQAAITEIATDCGPRVAQKARTRLVTALERAVAFNLVARNVARVTEVPKAPEREKGYWQPHEVEAFLEFTSGRRWHNAYLVALGTGLRISEILGLRWGDVGEEELTVRNGVVIAQSHVVIGPPKTKAGMRVVPIGEAVAEAFEAQAELAGGRNPEHYVFGTLAGGPQHPTNFAHDFTDDVAAAVAAKKCKRITFHGLRHTYASLQIADGIDVQTLATILGHARPSITLDTYTHFFEARRKRSGLDLRGVLQRLKGSSQGSKGASRKKKRVQHDK
jgi:integrase